jgi:uncharacterized membrane protein SpoIIM required for sporulation
VKFLAGWLLPHGVIEIPAILIAGQVDCSRVRSLVGAGQATCGRALREISRDLVTLIAGVGLMLVWAGLIDRSVASTRYSYSARRFCSGLALLVFLPRAGKLPTHSI